jgi:ribosomal protein L12E/L44/L45/RPP1/RPP2
MNPIQSLGKVNQRKLRHYIVSKLNLKPSSRIQTIVKELNAKNIDEAYELMKNSYNKTALVIKAVLQAQRKEKNKNITKQRKEKKTSLKKIVKTLNKFQIAQKYRAMKAKKDKVIVIPNKGDMMSKLKKSLSRFIEKSVVIDFAVNKRLVQTNQFDIPKSFSSWWKATSRSWWRDSDHSIFDDYEEGNVFIYPQKENIDSTFVIQHFRDGITNCMLTPIREWATEKLEEASSKSTTSTTFYRYKQILGKLNDYDKLFANGVPENAIAELCNNLQIDISVELPFCETTFIQAQSIKKRLKLFRYMNSRLNHVDHNEVVCMDKPIEITEDELLKMTKVLDEINEFYTYKKKGGNICSITTLEGTFKINNQFAEVVSEFEIETGLNFCKIDDIDDKDLSAFVKEGTNYNETVDFVEPEFVEVGHSFDFIPDLKHIDMEKAYANFRKCMMYKGFLGKITDFRQTDKIEGVGMYRITKLDFSQCEPLFKQYNEKMKIYLDNNVYCSPELDMLANYGVRFKVASGCWGVKPIDFQFSDEMLNTKMVKSDGTLGASYYAKWSGLSDSHILEKQYWIKCDDAYFNIVKAQCGADVARRYENGEACFAYKKKHNYHLAHITAFLTCYQRISVLEQLMEIPIENVVRVCVDGIYFQQKGFAPALKNVFRFKEDRKFSNIASDSYVSEACVKSLRDEYGAPREIRDKRNHYAKELHLGEGGCGKTHMNLRDLGLVRPLYVAPSWKLAVAKKRETDINTTVWARALTDDPERISAIKERANVLIVDEVSMLTENGKEKFFELYGDMKIIMCGDLSYQLPCIDGVEMKPTGFDSTVKHTTDYRCNDKALRTIKTSLREMIHYDLCKKEINSWVLKEFKRLGRTISVQRLKDMYNVDDMILSGTNANKDYFTSMFAGKFEIEKYYITDNTRLHQNGEIVIGEKPEKCSCEVRHCFTTHSIQGETAEHKLFIDSSAMFDSRMFYTAISRARRLDQIYIIEDTEKCAYSIHGKIYKIVSEGGTYIGSTISTIEKRFKEHQQSFKQYKAKKGKYMTSFELLGDKDVRIELVLNYPCNSKAELQLEEARIIRSVECVNKTFAEGK